MKINIDKNTLNKLEKIASKTTISVDEIVLNLIKNYIEYNDIFDKKKEEFETDKDIDSIKNQVKKIELINDIINSIINILHKKL